MAELVEVRVQRVAYERANLRALSKGGAKVARRAVPLGAPTYTRVPASLLEHGLVGMPDGSLATIERLQPASKASPAPAAPPSSSSREVALRRHFTERRWSAPEIEKIVASARRRGVI